MGGSASAPKTGRVGAGTAFSSEQAVETYQILKDILGQIQKQDIEKGSSLLAQKGRRLLRTGESSRLRKNLSTAETVIARERGELLNNLSRSLVDRGGANSGLASTAVASAEGKIRGTVLNDAIKRSFDESLQANELGGKLTQALTGQQQGFANLLSDMISRLVGTGVSGQAQTYAARSGAGAQTTSSLYGALG